jgi:hypothetical protein
LIPFLVSFFTLATGFLLERTGNVFREAFKRRHCIVPTDLLYKVAGTALTFVVTLGDKQRFRRSRDVGYKGQTQFITNCLQCPGFSKTSVTRFKLTQCPLAGLAHLEPVKWDTPGAEARFRDGLRCQGDLPALAYLEATSRTKAQADPSPSAPLRVRMTMCE